MRAAWLCAAMAGWPGFLRAQEHAAALVVHVEAGDEQSVKSELLALTQDQLGPEGFVVDPKHAWLSMSRPLPGSETFEVRPLWSAGAGVPPLPLMFELRPVSHSVAAAAFSAEPVHAALGVRLLQEVWVAARRLRKGSIVSCADLSIEVRDVRDVPKLPCAPPCTIEPDVVALRDIARGDVVRAVDIGAPPDVMAGELVRVSVSGAGINVTTIATALADAKVGDRIDVRLQHPVRTLRVRVTGPGSAQLTDERP